MRGFKIREAVSLDREAMVTLARAVQAEPELVDFMRQSLVSPLCLVAEREDRVVGYGVLEYTFFGNGFVSMLYVAESQRRRGVGRGLLEALAERCATPKLFTSTNESNEPMQRLLEGLGYVPSGRVENLDPGDPEVFYFFDLPSRAE